MPGRGTRRQMVVVVLGLAMMLGPIAGNAAMSAAQLRGKQIYLEGISPGGSEITAIVGTEGVALPASGNRSGRNLASERRRLAPSEMSTKLP